MIPFVATILNIGASIKKHKGYRSAPWRRFHSEAEKERGVVGLKGTKAFNSRLPNVIRK